MTAPETITQVLPIVTSLSHYTVEGSTECAPCGRAITIQLLIEGDVIVDAGGMVESCNFTRECMAALIATVIGMNVYDAQAVSTEDIHPRMASVVEKLGCDNWPVAALRIALRNYRLQEAA